MSSIFSSLYQLPEALPLSTGYERKEDAEMFDLFLPSLDGTLLICFTSGLDRYHHLVHLFKTRNGQVCKRYLLTLPYKVFLSCPCMDKADGSIWINGQSLDEFEGSNLLYKIVFNEDSLTAHAVTVCYFYPFVIWAAVKNGNYRAISSPRDSHQLLFHEFRLSDSNYRQSQIGRPDQQHLLTDLHGKMEFSFIRQNDDGYECNGQVYFNISAEFSDIHYRLVVFDIEQKTISFLLTNPDPISGRKPQYRTSPGFFGYGETLYLMGGTRTYDEHAQCKHRGDDMNDCWSLNLNTGTWHNVAENHAVFVGSQHALVAPNGSVIIVKSF